MTSNTCDKAASFPQLQHNISSKGRHPFQDGAAYSKHELMRCMRRPSSNSWTGLAASMWIRKALRDMPDDHPDREGLLQRLQENNKFSAKLVDPAAACGTQRRDSCATDSEESSTHTQEGHPKANNDDIVLNTDGFSHAEVPSQLSNPSDEYNNFTFHLHKGSGYPKFNHWVNECLDAADPVHEITIKHQAFSYGDADSRWFTVDSDATFTLLPCGNVKVVHSNTLEDPVETCNCDSENKWEDREDEAPGPDTTLSLANFAKALSSQDDSHLIDLASDFVDLLDEYNEVYESVSSCRNCDKPMLYSRTYRPQNVDLQLVTEPPCMSREAGAPQMPPTSAPRNSTPRFSHGEVKSLFEETSSLHDKLHSLQREALLHQEVYCSLLDAHPLAMPLEKPILSDNTVVLSAGLDISNTQTDAPSEMPMQDLGPAQSEILLVAPETPNRTTPSIPALDSPQSTFSEEKTSGDDCTLDSTPPSTVESSPSSFKTSFPTERDGVQRLSKRFSVMDLRSRSSGGGSVSDLRGMRSSVDDIGKKDVKTGVVRCESKSSGGTSFGRKLVNGLKRK